MKKGMQRFTGINKMEVGREIVYKGNNKIMYITAL